MRSSPSIGGYDFAMHTVVVLALPDTIAFDLSTPVEVFGRVRLPGGRPGYRLRACSTEPVVPAGPLRLAPDPGLDPPPPPNTAALPRRHTPRPPTPAAVAQ